VVEREKQLKEAKFLAEAADNLKSAFLANMSHEIRTPLNAVVGFAQLLRDANPSPADVERYVGLITSNSYNLLQLINDIIDLSQIESGQIKIVSRKVCLSKFQDELYTFAQEKLNSDIFIHSEKSIEIRVEPLNVSEEDCIYTDPFRIRQIMEQLIDNALKFTNKGEVTIGFNITDRLVELFVSDTGVGIADEHTSKIFERFVQVEEYLTRQYGGTGLGLAICHELIPMLNGTIHVDSKLDVGSKFTVKIPKVNDNLKE
jgi:signal transduction histidine kinase